MLYNLYFDNGDEQSTSPIVYLKSEEVMQFIDLFFAGQINNDWSVNISVAIDQDARKR